MDLSEYLPYYPNIKDFNFYQDIFNKKEFRDLERPEKVDGFYPWQVFIQRFISNWTLYQSLILIHDTGTGKSGSAAVVFDGLKKIRTNLKTVYVVHNETSLNNFKNEIFKLSFILYDDSITDQENYILKRNQIFKKNNVSFYTYYRFALEIKKGNITPEQYEEQLIILDEVHHLISHDVEIPSEIRMKLKKDKLFKKDDFKPYDYILDFLSQINYKKLLLMTATPMRNSASEIAPLLNLVLPPDERFLTGQKFIDVYFEKSQGIIPQIPILSWKKENEERFLEKIKGYISVIKQNPDIKVEYAGAVYPPMTSFKLYVNKMSVYQSGGYEKALLLDRSDSKKEDESSFFTHTQQAGLFVFPESLSGVAGAKIYQKTNKYFTDEFKKMTGFRSLRCTALDKLTPHEIQTMQHNLERLENYSTTYHSIIDQILKNRRKKIYIYSDKINGSGICIFLQLLKEFFGYDLLVNTASVQKNELPRVIYLHNEQCNGKPANVSNLIQVFNSPENAEGRLAQVIVGTDKTREGISLFQIEQIHICSGDWNFGKIYQAIGRGIRLNSHRGLPPGSKVQIFLHCALPQGVKKDYFFRSEGGFGSSIDFYKYFRSEGKDKNIKLIENCLIRAAVDCQIHKERNSRLRFEDYSPDCYYKKCRYECLGIHDKKAPVDSSTYDLYYIEEFFKETVRDVQKLFYEKISYTLPEIEARLQHLTKKQIIDTLLIVIDAPVPVRFHDGRTLYVNYSNDVLYLSEDRIQIPYQDTRQLWIAMYDRYPAIDASLNFEELLQRMQNSSIKKVCNKLYEAYEKQDKKQASATFALFSDEVKKTIFTLIAQEKRGNELFDWLRDRILNDILYKKDGRFVLKYNDEHLMFDAGIWKKSKTTPSRKEGSIDHNDPKFIEKYITNNPKKIYGFFEDSKFKIRDVSNFESFKNEKSSTKGMFCMSFPFYYLIYFIYQLMGPALPEPKDQERLEAKNKLQSIRSLNALKTRAINHMSEEVYKNLLLLLKKTDKTITEEDLRFLIYFATTYKKDELCALIQKQIEKEDLIVRPPIKKIIIKRSPKKRGRKPKKIIGSVES